MKKTKTSKSAPACKVILLRSTDGQMRFAVRPPDEGGGLPPMPFPGLMAIDRALEDFAASEARLGRPRVHGGFVERPHPAGTIYYLVEDTEPPAGAEGGTLLWLPAREALTRMDPEERKALARAIGYLSGQHFAGTKKPEE